jgi:hypothetical protein
MKVTKTTELDRLKMIYPSSAENPIFEAMLFAEISNGVGTDYRGPVFPGYPALSSFKASCASGYPVSQHIRSV